MPGYDSNRRKFVKFSAGGLALSSFTGASKEHLLPLAAENPPDKKLKIICVGAHPGHPQVGCGGILTGL